METDRVLEEEDLPAIVVRIENEDIEQLNPYLGPQEVQAPTNTPSMFMFEHNENGELVVPDRNKSKNACNNELHTIQAYSIEIVAAHKSGAMPIVQELWYEVMKAVSDADIDGLIYDGSYVLRPNQEEVDMLRYGRVLRYNHLIKYNAASPNSYNKR